MYVARVCEREKVVRVSEHVRPAVVSPSLRRLALFPAPPPLVSRQASPHSRCCFRAAISRCVLARVCVQELNKNKAERKRVRDSHLEEEDPDEIKSKVWAWRKGGEIEGGHGDGFE